MRKYLLTSLFLTFLVFFIPWLMADPLPAAEIPPSPEIPEVTTPPPENTVSSSPAAIPTGERDSARTLRVLLGDEVVTMDMGTYLVGVVRSEMPAVFESEALKAQAVAARTYTLYKMEHGGSANHPQADTCDDITCCKAYMDTAAAAENWGENAAFYEEKIRDAVRSTDGQCVLYESAPILAVFHSSSAGATLDASAVWSESLPYLVSVSSPEDSETVPGYYSSATFPFSVLRAMLQTELPEADLSSAPTDWFTAIRQTPSGAVTELEVGGIKLTGNRLRTILGLRSPSFTISFEDESVTFSVVGYGHGVGMSQYGANVLAASGMDYREILAWYYAGTTIEVY